MTLPSLLILFINIIKSSDAIFIITVIAIIIILLLLVLLLSSILLRFFPSTHYCISTVFTERPQ